MQVKLIQEEIGYQEYDVTFAPSEIGQLSHWLSHLKVYKVGVRLNGEELYRFASLQERCSFIQGLDYYQRKISSTQPITASWWQKLRTTISRAISESKEKIVWEFREKIIVAPNTSLALPFTDPDPHSKSLVLECSSDQPINVFVMPEPELAQFNDDGCFFDFARQHNTTSVKLRFSPLPTDIFDVVFENLSNTPATIRYRLWKDILE